MYIVKKTLAILCSLTIAVTLFSGCGAGSGGQSTLSAAEELPSQRSAMPSLEAKALVRVGALQGPTGLGMVQLMEKNEHKQTDNMYTFELAGAPDVLSGKIISGELDIAAVPTNLAAVLQNKTEGKIKILAVNTLGVLYLLQKTEGDALTSLADLEGQTIYSAGQGATQEYVLNYLLEKQNISDVTVEYKAEHAELAALMIGGNAELALLPQPFVTTVMSQDESVTNVLNIAEEWATATDGTPLTMGCIIVRSDFLEKNQTAVDNFIKEYAASTAFVNENVAEAAALSGKFEVIKEEVAKKAIPQCNIVCMTGEEMQTAVSAYLEVLYQADAKSVGGSLPDDAFYYVGQ